MSGSEGDTPDDSSFSCGYLAPEWYSLTGKPSLTGRCCPGKSSISLRVSSTQEPFPDRGSETKAAGISFHWMEFVHIEAEHGRGRS